jgi:hypothetical protein
MKVVVDQRCCAVLLLNPLHSIHLTFGPLGNFGSNHALWEFSLSQDAPREMRELPAQDVVVAGYLKGLTIPFF